MPTTVKAWAAREAGGAFEPFEYDLPEIGPQEVDVRVAHCGVCHSDLSMKDDAWGMTAFPFVGGHEIVGVVERVGEQVPHVKRGDNVGVGWFTRSCMHCRQCLSGHHNRCPEAEMTIVGRHGGFADRVRSHWGWVTPLPGGLDPASVGPMFCGGITVFNPIVAHGIKPTSHVGVIGIGGLGHLALQFLDAWGCEVTAFSTSPEKEHEARRLGADHFVNAKESGAIDGLASRFDLVLNTTNASLDWDAYVRTLKPGGALHTVGAVLDGFGVSGAFPLILGEKSLSGSPVGAPATVAEMLEFAARRGVAPVVERVPMERINDAFEKVKSNKARYRMVLDA